MAKSIAAQTPRLSLIIPARNEARRLPPSLQKIANFFSKTDYSTEVVVVDNGSTDGTSDIVREFAGRHSWLPITVISEPRPGKGAAVRTGMLHATGDTLFLCDADLSMPIEEIEKFLEERDAGCDIAIGCREGSQASRMGEPIHRYLMGRAFNGLVQSLMLPGIPDTQCGFKAFRREVAHDLFAVQTINGWGFDVEILTVARQRGYTLRSVPITWNYDADSRIRPFWDALAMLQDAWVIHQQLRCGMYDRRIPSPGARIRPIANPIGPIVLPSLGATQRWAA